MRLMFLATLLSVFAACGGSSSPGTADAGHEASADTTTTVDLGAADKGGTTDTAPVVDALADRTASDSGSSTCDSIPGNWAMTGTCGAVTCTVTQTACTASFSCVGGMLTFSAAISGHDLSYTHPTMGACTGTISGSTMTGTCAGGATCNFSGARQ